MSNNSEDNHDVGVGTMAPKIPSRGVSSTSMCQSFKNNSETLWQFANRIAPGPGGKTNKLNEVANWKIMLGGRLDTGITLKQVAEAAGFQNEKSFMRAFKGWTGLSPAEFRRQATPQG